MLKTLDVLIGATTVLLLFNMAVICKVRRPRTDFTLGDPPRPQDRGLFRKGDQRVRPGRLVQMDDAR